MLWHILIGWCLMDISTGSQNAPDRWKSLENVWWTAWDSQFEPSSVRKYPDRFRSPSARRHRRSATSGQITSASIKRESHFWSFSNLENGNAIIAWPPILCIISDDQSGKSNFRWDPVQDCSSFKPVFLIKKPDYLSLFISLCAL